jgi:CheY-like chemotaxis protein
MSAKVLIVEDSPTTRTVIQVYLLGHRLEFLEAGDGAAGLALARQHHPAVIIVDLKMPGMDGLTFCRNVRSDQRLKNTPIILLTASKGDEIRREALRSGASFFMTKPIDSHELSERILACIEQQR